MPEKMPVYELVLMYFVLSIAESSDSICWRLGEFDPQVLEVDGDVILGGLFPLHYLAPEPDHTFLDRAQDKKCSG